MAAAAGVSRAAVIAGSIPLDADVMGRFERMVGRRAAREPLAYIVGHREFYSLEFVVRPGVLIPRPETETVVEAALGFLRERPAARVLDIGTGSGVIAVAMAANAPEAQIVAIDISKASLRIAAENARRHGCAGRIALVEADYAALDARALPFASFDLIVSNPPYITQADLRGLAPEVRDFEPRLALDGGVDGMAFYRKIAAGLTRWFADQGELILEVGAGQAEAVEAIILDAMRIEARSVEPRRARLDAPRAPGCATSPASSEWFASAASPNPRSPLAMLAASLPTTRDQPHSRWLGPFVVAHSRRTPYNTDALKSDGDEARARTRVGASRDLTARWGNHIFKWTR